MNPREIAGGGDDIIPETLWTGLLCRSLTFPLSPEQYFSLYPLPFWGPYVLSVCPLQLGLGELSPYRFST